MKESFVGSPWKTFGKGCFCINGICKCTVVFKLKIYNFHIYKYIYCIYQNIQKTFKYKFVIVDLY